ncbi:hypothetical protein ACWEOW_11225 [Monashia sp. NPDC004114]
MGAIKDLRTDLNAALLANLLPASAYNVIKYSRNIDPPTKSTVMLRFDGLAPGPVLGTWTFKWALVLVAAKTTSGAGDDEIDDLLVDVVHVLDQIGAAVPGITWSEATRSVYPPDTQTNPAYEVAMTVATSKE